jgi:hypothetical protein
MESGRAGEGAERETTPCPSYRIALGHGMGHVMALYLCSEMRAHRGGKYVDRAHWNMLIMLNVNTQDS